MYAQEASVCRLASRVTNDSVENRMVSDPEQWLLVVPYKHKT